MEPRLSKSDIRILRCLAGQEPSTVSGLDETTGLTIQTVSQELSVLSDLGFIHREKRGQTKYVRFSDTKHARLLRNMIAHSPQLRYEDLLAGKSLDVLSAIHLLRLRSIKEIEEYSRTSHVKVIELLALYKQLGVVAKKGGVYCLGARYGPLGDFLYEFRSYMNLKTLRAEVSDAMVVWERDRDVLFRTSIPLTEPYVPSAFSAFPRFGVDVFVGDGDYYFYSPRSVQVGVEEAAVHAMLAAEGARERTLILLVLLKSQVDEERILRLAGTYGSGETAWDFLEYVRTEGERRPKGFPDWRELSRRLREFA
jgi:predicted transcriptional regulator